MGFSGNTIKKIRTAITSAFPNRDRLVMMLRTELDIPEPEVPNYSDYSLVVFNLIQKIETQGRMRELIKGALQEVPGNSDLQEVAKEIDAIFIDPSDSQLLKWFEFDVITLDVRGWKINRKKRQAQYFAEELGNNITLEMVAIPGGTFMMGASRNEKNSGDDERPQHQVTIQPCFISKYPVTQAQWRTVAALPQVNQQLDPDPSKFKGDDRPVEQITWYSALEFCSRLNFRTDFTIGRDYRLPNEAEWEYVCRAGTTTPFYFGETITTDVANYNGNYTYGNASEGKYREGTTSVGSFPPNAFGLYDMHGNVWEWCEDTWHENYEGAPTEGSVWIGNDNNPRLLRGGSWDLNPDYCRSADRYGYFPVVRVDYIGFRVVCGAAARTQ